MTTEPAQDGTAPRRKFDDVASLYAPRPSGVGNASRFPPHRPAFIPMPPTYTAPVKRPEPAPPQDPADPELPTEGLADTPVIPSAPLSPPATPLPRPPIQAARAPATPPNSTPPSSTTTASARTRPAEIPWPDAFEPRPNYRKRDGRSWSWLLLLPAGLVAAAAITLVDARSVRTWIDTTILHRTPIAGTLDSPLLPGAFRAGTTKTPSTGTPPAATTASKPTEADIPYPAIPTSPLPVPPGTEVSPPPSEPADPAAATVPTHVNIQFRRNIPGADGEARRIAALLQSYGGSVELHPNATTARVPTINYYNAADKDAATALATTLSNEAASWIVRLGTTKNPPGTLDVWLP